MNRIVKTFKTAFERKEERGWDRIYVVVDIHETILKPNYGGLSTEFYDYAVDVLRLLSDREDVKLIIWTCSKAEDIEVYQKLFKSENIHFDYVNDNPEVKGKLNWGDYDAKMYTNVLLDDKAGFSADHDWLPILGFLSKLEDFLSKYEQ